MQVDYCEFLVIVEMRQRIARQPQLTQTIAKINDEQINN